MVGLIQRSPENLAGQCPGVLSTFQQHLAVDNHIIYPDGAPLHVLGISTGRGIIHRLPWFGGDGVSIEDGYVGGLSRGDEAAVMEFVHQGGLSRQPVDGVFQGHNLLFPDPVAQQIGAVLVAVHCVRPRAAVRWCR